MEMGKTVNFSLYMGYLSQSLLSLLGPNSVIDRIPYLKTGKSPQNFFAPSAQFIVLSLIGTDTVNKHDK